MNTTKDGKVWERWHKRGDDCYVYRIHDGDERRTFLCIATSWEEADKSMREHDHGAAWEVQRLREASARFKAKVQETVDRVVSAANSSPAWPIA